MTLLVPLISAIAAFFANPSDANRLALLNLKQLIQNIINILKSPNPDLSELFSLLPQFYSILAPFFFSLIINPSRLQLLLNLLTQLIGATPGTGSTRPTGQGLTTVGFFY